MAGAIADIAGRHPSQTIVVIGHGGATVDLARTLIGDKAVRSMAPRAIERGIPNCALTELVASAGTLSLVSLGRDTAPDGPAL
jgi:broad specificity phosphatase PhoE